MHVIIKYFDSWESLHIREEWLCVIIYTRDIFRFSFAARIMCIFTFLCCLVVSLSHCLHGGHEVSTNIILHINNLSRLCLTQVLAIFLKGEGRTKEAIAVMKRIRVMEEELAEVPQEEEGEGG